MYPTSEQLLPKEEQRDVDIPHWAGRVEHFKNLRLILLMTVCSTITCSGYQAEGTRKVSLSLRCILLPSFFFFFFFFFSEKMTAKQTPLNNENVLPGSNASLAKPVSCQTVKTVLKWGGWSGGLWWGEWPSSAVALQPYKSSRIHDLYCMLRLSPAPVSPPPPSFPVPAWSFHKCFFSLP